MKVPVKKKWSHHPWGQISKSIVGTVRMGGNTDKEYISKEQIRQFGSTKGQKKSIDSSRTQDPYRSLLHTKGPSSLQRTRCGVFGEQT